MILIDQQSRRWWIPAAIGGGIGLILLDETVVGVALPSIRQDLGLSQIGSHRVINAYLDYFQKSSEGSVLEQNPAVQVYVGIDPITTEQGVLEFSETGLSDTKSRRFAGIGEITSATGDLAGYSGTVVGMGDSDSLLTTGTISRAKE